MSHTSNIVKRAILGYIESPAFAPAPFPSVDTEDWDALINNEKSRHAMAVRGEEVLRVTVFILLSAILDDELSEGMIQLIRELLLSAELWKKILDKIDESLLDGSKPVLGGLHAIVGRLWHSPGVKAYAVVDWIHSILGPLATVASAAYRANPPQARTTRKSLRVGECTDALAADLGFLTRLQNLQLVDVNDTRDDSPSFVCESQVTSSPAGPNIPGPSGIERELGLLLDEELPTSEAYKTFDQPPALLPALEVHHLSRESKESPLTTI